MGSTSVWNFLISFSALRAFGFLAFLLTTSSLGLWYSFWGHLVATVGGLGLPLWGTIVAIALLARSRGGRATSTTVSDVMVGGSGVGTLSYSKWGGSKSGSLFSTVPAAGEVGGLACKSSTKSSTSLTFWGGGGQTPHWSTPQLSPMLGKLLQGGRVKGLSTLTPHPGVRVETWGGNADLFQSCLWPPWGIWPLVTWLAVSALCSLFAQFLHVNNYNYTVGRYTILKIRIARKYAKIEQFH